MTKPVSRQLVVEININIDVAIWIVIALSIGSAQLTRGAVVVAVAVAFLAFLRDIRCNPGVIEITGLSADFNIASVLAGFSVRAAYLAWAAWVCVGIYWGAADDTPAEVVCRSAWVRFCLTVFFALLEKLFP